MNEQARGCFVPNCECTNGVAFPKDMETKQQWLEGLNLKDAQPKDDDFVCLGHFEPRDLDVETVPGRA